MRRTKELTRRKRKGRINKIRPLRFRLVALAADERERHRCGVVGNLHFLLIHQSTRAILCVNKPVTGSQRCPKTSGIIRRQRLPSAFGVGANEDNLDAGLWLTIRPHHLAFGVSPRRGGDAFEANAWIRGWSGRLCRHRSLQPGLPIRRAVRIRHFLRIAVVIVRGSSRVFGRKRLDPTLAALLRISGLSRYTRQSSGWASRHARCSGRWSTGHPGGRHHRGTMHTRRRSSRLRRCCCQWRSSGRHGRSTGRRSDGSADGCRAAGGLRLVIRHLLIRSHGL